MAALESGSPSSSLSPPLTPIPQSPVSTTIKNQFETPTTPIDEKCPNVESANSSPQVLDKPEQNRFEGVFQVPSKPIDVPSSSRHNRQPPQRSDSETSSIHMEVDEVSGTAEKTAGNTDIDSGIENMEVSYDFFDYFMNSIFVVCLLHTCSITSLKQTSIDVSRFYYHILF